MGGAFGAFDAFVVALDGSGTLLRNAFLGGAADESGSGIAVDALGGVHVAGIGAGAWGAPGRPFSGAYDVFVARVENASNTAPVAFDQAPSIPQEAAAAITLSATDADGDSLTYTVLTEPAHGTLGGTPPGLTYQPAPGYVGTDEFTFQAHDGWLGSTIATVAITVTADVTLPIGSILINNGAASTSTPEVTLNLTATDVGGSGLLSMRFRNSIAEPYTAWEPYQTTRAWTLLAGAGTRRVYVQFRDLAGNISDANPAVAGAQAYQDSITLAP